uniref:Rad21_Rec8_N domain-containing protein n=1 Tax=Toxocara canis TaxID=6265 RepID=A0A183UY45_TOXCA
LEANVGSYCSRLLVTLDPEGEHNRSPRFSLYLLAQLSGGVVLLHVKRTELLLKDFEKLKVLVYRKVPKRVEGPDASGTARIAHPSDITLSEMIPLPRYDDFADDFGVITPEQRRILQETLSNGVGSGNGMPMRGERLIEHSSSSGDRAHELNVVDDRVSAVLAPTEVRTATVQDSVEVSEESGEKGQNSVYDFREEERASVVVQEHVSDPLSSLALEVLSLDDQPSRAPVNVRRRILADEETCLSTRFLRSRMENWADTVRRPREMIMHVPVRGFIDCKELFDRRPATLRRSAQLCELFDGPLRDQISFAFSDADISTSPSAKRRRDEGKHKCVGWGARRRAYGGVMVASRDQQDSDDRLSESLVNSDAIEGTNPQNSVENLDSVERPVLSDKHTADELLEYVS